MKTNFGGLSSSPLRISLFGVGGAGSSILHGLKPSVEDSCSVYSVNSDARLLAESKAPCKIKLGEGVTYGLGAGGDPTLGSKMAKDGESSFVRAFEGCDVAVFVAGLGGGTGSGALPVMAKLAREMGVFLVSVVTMPFGFEGARRRSQAEEALESVSLYSDIVMVFENDWMGSLLEEGGLAHDVFAAASKLMAGAVSFVPRLLHSSGLLDLGLDDLKAALSGKGNRCLFGSAQGNGDAAGICASLFDSPLLKHEVTIPSGADVLVHVSGGKRLTFARVQELLEALALRLPDDVRTHMGVSVSDEDADDVELVLFSSMEPSSSAPDGGSVSSAPAEEREKEIPATVNAPDSIPPVRIITVPVDPVDSVPVAEDSEREDNEDSDSLEEDTYLRPEFGEDHLILESTFRDDEEDDEELPQASSPAKKPADSSPASKAQHGASEVTASGKGLFDGGVPFVVDGEDLDLPPSMRRRS